MRLYASSSNLESQLLCHQLSNWRCQLCGLSGQQGLSQLTACSRTQTGCRSAGICSAGHMQQHTFQFAPEDVRLCSPSRQFYPSTVGGQGHAVTENGVRLTTYSKLYNFFRALHSAGRDPLSIKAAELNHLQWRCSGYQHLHFFSTLTRLAEHLPQGSLW